MNSIKIMLSVFIFYSDDRYQQLQWTIDFLNKMPEFSQAQKILVVDGETNHKPEGFKIVNVPRENGNFVWSNMWEAGVKASIYDNLFYIDSDRLLPSNFLTLALEQLKEKRFIFTSKHFLILQEYKNIENLWLRVDTAFKKSIIDDPHLAKLVKFDIRHRFPHHGPGKNVMSGSTVFKKQTFLELGGVDKNYCGHGAFADTDFHMTAFQVGCDFIDLNVTELHCYHTKEGLSQKSIEKLTLDNFIYYLSKWDLPARLAYNMAANLRIDPNYVFEKIKEHAKVSG